MVADFPKNISVAEEYFGTLLITIFGMAKDCGARAHYRKTHENVWKCGIRTSIYINSLPEKVCDFFEKPDKIPVSACFSSFWATHSDGIFLRSLAGFCVSITGRLEVLYSGGDLLLWASRWQQFFFRRFQGGEPPIYSNRRIFASDT